MVNNTSDTITAFTVDCTNSINSGIDGLICIGVPVIGGVFILLSIITCCVGLCLYKKKQKGSLKPSDGPSEPDVLVTADTPIDLATGQLNQLEAEVAAASINQSLPVKERVNKEEFNLMKNPTYQVKPAPEETMIQTSMTLPKQALSVNNDSVTNLSTKQQPSPLHSIPSAEMHTVPSDIEMIVPSDTPVLPKPRKRVHSYEEIDTKELESRQEGDVKEGPLYDDVLTSTEVSIKLQQEVSSNPKEHKYHILCNPTEMGATGETTASHMYNNMINTSGESADADRVLPGESSAKCTPQRRKHHYEEIPTDMTTDNKEGTLTKTSSQELYNVLANPMDVTALPEGIVQEDAAESPFEDKYYSTARVHRLIPVGKLTGSRIDDHLYQVLDEQNLSKSRLESKDYEQVQARHHTFTTSTKLSQSKEQLVRTYSGSVERLDPMYDEPYNPQLRKAGSERLDIYNIESLFDDPKYSSRSAVSSESNRQLLHTESNVSVKTRSNENVVLEDMADVYAWHEVNPERIRKTK